MRESELLVEFEIMRESELLVEFGFGYLYSISFIREVHF